jgi:hypothetical protein
MGAAEQKLRTQICKTKDTKTVIYELWNKNAYYVKGNKRKTQNKKTRNKKLNNQA